MTRRSKGFITLSRASLHSLDHDFTLPQGTKYVYVRLTSLVDHRTGGMVFMLADLVEEVNAPRPSLHRDLKRLQAVGLIVWEPARNQERAGQLRLPFYDWTLGIETAVSPPSHRRLTGETTTPELPAETAPLEVKKSRITLAPPSADARELREQISKAIAEACGTDLAGMTASARGALAKAAKELHAVGAGLDEIKARARRYRLKWPNATLTPSALAKHWAEFADKQANGTTSPAYMTYQSPEWLEANRPYWEVTP